jgi:hypothetical protein
MSRRRTRNLPDRAAPMDDRAGEDAGARDRLLAYLTQVANNDPGAFYRLLIHMWTLELKEHDRRA